MTDPANVSVAVFVASHIPDVGPHSDFDVIYDLAASVEASTRPKDCC